MRLNGKTALVTGAASGFGVEIAATFAREGAKVVIMDLNGEGAEATAKSIGAAARAIKGDVTKAADIDAAVAEAGRRRHHQHRLGGRHPLGPRPLG